MAANVCRILVLGIFRDDWSTHLHEESRLPKKEGRVRHQISSLQKLLLLLSTYFHAFSARQHEIAAYERNAKVTSWNFCQNKNQSLEAS